MILFKFLIMSASVIKVLLFTQQDMIELPFTVTTENNYTFSIPLNNFTKNNHPLQIRSLQMRPSFINNAKYWKSSYENGNLVNKLLFDIFSSEQLESPSLNPEILEFILATGQNTVTNLVLSKLENTDRIDLLIHMLFISNNSNLDLFKNTIYLLIKNSIIKNESNIRITDTSNFNGKFYEYGLLLRTLCSSNIDASEINELFNLIKINDDLFLFLSKVANDFSIYNRPLLNKLYEEAINQRQ